MLKLTLLSIFANIILADVYDIRVGFRSLDLRARGVPEEILEEFVGVLLFHHQSRLMRVNR